MALIIRSPRLVRTALLVATLGGTAVAATCPPQPPELLADTDTRYGSQQPGNFLAIGDTLYFTTFGAGVGNELWKTDGSAAGTTLVADINPGRPDSSPRGLANVGGQLFFSADDGMNGRELWTSDGTPGGTLLVKDINPGPASSEPSSIADVGGRAFLAADDGTSGAEPWTSDGTPGGTALVSDVRSGPEGSSPAAFADLAGAAFFAADDGIAGSELWSSDGTGAGTRLVKDICAGGSSAPSSLVDFGGTLYFAADECSGDLTLWKTDGTAPGTLRVASLGAGQDYERASDLTPVGPFLYFRTRSWRQSLWVTDGSLTTEIVSGVNDIAMAAMGGRLYVGIEGELMIVDGAAGTAMPIATVSDRYDVIELADLSGTLILLASNTFGTMRLWTSDGSPGGTIQVATVDGVGDEFAFDPPSGIAVTSSFAFFAGEDAVNGHELWRSDGTVAGTAMVQAIAPATRGPWSVRAPHPLDDRLFFCVVKDDPDPDWGMIDAKRGELWVTDGTPAGTQALPPFAGLGGFATLGDVVLFDGCNPPACEQHGLWRSDGTPGGTFLVDDRVEPTRIIRAGEVVYLTSGPNQGELWRTGGTAATTRRIAAFPAIRALAATPTRLFLVSDDFSDASLCISDGTPAGTRVIAPLPDSPDVMVPAGERMFLVMAGALWVSDGTAPGTFQLRDGVSSQQLPMALGDRLLFTAYDPDTGNELFVSDGTVAGTGLVADIRPGDLGSLRNLWGTVLDAHALFLADDGVSGAELWSSDGTAAGTMLLRDINPGPDGTSGWTVPVVSGCRAYFLASSPATGEELWTTDGTAAGTTLAAGWRPGDASLAPTPLASWSGRMLLVVDDSMLGREPHAVILDADGDLVGDACDTCACLANPDADADGAQDDGDSDADGFGDACDPCPSGADADVDGDRLPDDADDDSVLDGCDPCPDEAPDDADGDGVCDGMRSQAPLGAGDNCAALPNPSQADADGDSWGDACDACPLADADADLDGEPDDADGDRASDACDPCPDDAPDDPDGDGWCAGARFNAPSIGGSDRCPATSDAAQPDADGDTTGDACDCEPADPAIGAPGARLLADLAPGLGDSLPVRGARVGSLTYFAAGGSGLGRELWVTDGSTAGTRLVEDIRPGPEGSNPMGCTAVGSTLFFGADDGISGKDLWKTDGLPGGTVRVADLATVAMDSSDREQPVALGGILYFVGDDGVAGEELWRSDGTALGTSMVADIHPGAEDGSIGYLTVVGDRLLFMADDGVGGLELWASDGSAAGTVLVADIRPGANGSLSPSKPLVAGDKLLFAANDGAHGREPWVSDGTAAGTRMLSDVGLSGDLALAGDFLYFRIDNHALWKVGIAGGGPNLVTDIAPAAFVTGSQLVVLGQQFFFAADDDVTGAELWATDGTAGGTRLVSDIAPGSASSRPQQLVAWNGLLLFVAGNGVAGREVYSSDGTEAGTRILADVSPGPADSDPRFLQDLGARYLVVASDGATGFEPWLLAADLDGDLTPDSCDPDADGDGVASSAGDCDDRRADVLRDPAPVTDLRVTLDASDIALSWEDQAAVSGAAIRYDIVVGPLRMRPWDRVAPYAFAQCAVDALARSSLTLTITGSAWIVVRPSFSPTACAPGTYGPGGPGPWDALDAASPCP